MSLKCTNQCWSTLLYRLIALHFPTVALQQAGWEKQLSYIIAFSRHGVTDVVKRYTKQWDQLKQRRTLVTEDWLHQQCTTLTANHRR